MSDLSGNPLSFSPEENRLDAKLACLRKENEVLRAERDQLKAEVERLNRECISLFLHEQRMAAAAAEREKERR